MEHISPLPDANETRLLRRQHLLHRIPRLTIRLRSSYATDKWPTIGFNTVYTGR